MEDTETAEFPEAADCRSARDAKSESGVSWALLSALLSKNAGECRLLAERAGAQRDASAFPILCDLLQPPRGLAMRLRRRDWEQARLAAVHGLAQIAPDAACEPLARAILDPAPAVQEAAAQAVLQAETAAALPALNAALHNAADWPLNGMKRLVTTIGALRTPLAADALVPIVLGGQPRAPERWDRFFNFVFRAAACILLTVPTITLIETGSLGITFGVFVLLFFLLFIACGVFTVACVLPARAMREARERNAVAMQAAEGLRLCANKAYLPALVEGAFSYNRMWPIPSRRALVYLMRLLNADDADRFGSRAREQLTQAFSENRGGDGMDLALLRAMEWVGTGQAAARTERLATNGATSEVRAEAARILPLLQERRRQEQAPTQLLRASDALPAPSEQLLRPGYDVNAAPAAQLLRAGRADGE